MTEGYKALTRDAAVLDVSARTRIRVTGDDRARLLHALSTNHVQQLLPGHGCYAFFLNANGRILADANLFVFAEYILIDAEPEVRERLWAHLDHYIIADDVTLHDDAETTFSLAVEGPGANTRLCAVGMPVPADAFAHEVWQDCAIAHVSLTGEPGYRIFGPRERKTAVLDLLYLAEASPQDAETVRIENAKPRYGVDITASNIAAELDLPEALHFQKGCYLGQEIVERVRSRGRVNKHLVSIELTGNHVPEAGARLLVEEKEVGEITSVVKSPGLGQIVGLAYVRVPHDAPGSTIHAGTIPGSVRATPKKS